MAHDALEIVAEHGRHEDSAVTVAVSLYNYRDYVLTCLESAKAQTINDLDLIVVDDCSSDGGKDVVARWLKENNERFGRCTLVRHVENRGLAAARNTAFTRAGTQYVFVCDADNILYPRCLQQLASALDTTGASFAYCQLEKFGAMSGLENIHSWNAASLRTGNRIDGMVLLRRSVWDAVGGYSYDMPVMGWEDFDLWFKIARMKGWGVQVPEILARYRVHMDSMIHSVTNPAADRLWDYLRSKYSEFFGIQ
jgi:glycosyltransferase involved in cell wall biosynthesis